MTKKTLRAPIAAIAMMGFAPMLAAPALANPMVGGAAMYPTKTILDNAMNSKDHTTLVAAVKAAGLVDILSGAGPFTVFAPTNEAFAKLRPARSKRCSSRRKRLSSRVSSPIMSSRAR